MISRTSKLLDIYDLHASEPQQNHNIIKLWQSRGCI